MILTPHLLVGAMLASLVDNLALAAVLALFSHYLLDAIPHYDYSVKNIKEKNWQQSLPELLKIALDFSIGIVLILFLTKNLSKTITVVSFAALPDIITFFKIILPPNKILNAHHYIHNNISHWHRYKKIPLVWKILSQIAVIILSVLALK